MSDLELLADTMEEWSTTSGDHHMLAAAAIRQLIKLQASLQSGGSAPVAWHISKDPDGDQSSHVTADGEFASSYAQMGWKVSPLYTALQPVVPDRELAKRVAKRRRQFEALCAQVRDPRAGKGGE
jgi:hypothetical protein